jgi:hypothetical protein
VIVVVEVRELASQAAAANRRTGEAGSSSERPLIASGASSGNQA